MRHYSKNTTTFLPFTALCVFTVFSLIGCSADPSATKSADAPAPAGESVGAAPASAPVASRTEGFADSARMNKMPASLEAEMEKQNVSIAAKNTGQNTSLATPTESSAENATQNNEARFRGTVTGGTSMKGVARQSRTMSPGDPSTNMPATPPATTLNPNMYVASNYLGGSGQRERLEKLIQEGVLVDGKRVKLEAFAREYKQNFAIPTQKALNVFADTERSQIITSGDRTFLQVGIQAMQGETPQRPPLNIALVIDQSGSMSGENKMSDARKAARELVDRLRPDDTIAVVVFNDQAKLLVPAGRATDKNTLRKKIEAIQSGGGTNIYDGLKMGFYEASKASGGSGVVSLVILLSDGQVSSGIKDPDTFRKLVASHASDNDIQTTTVGVGVEYNEDLMLALAQEGKGNYHFLKNGADAPKVFAQELDDLSQIVAKAVKARIVLAPGVGLVRVLGTRKLDAQETQKVKADEKAIDRKVYEELGIQTNRQNEPEEPGIKMLIPNFHRGDSHVILLEVELPSGSGNKKVADVYLKYKDLARPANRQETVATSVTYTTDRSAAIASVDRNVKKNVLGFQTGEALMKAAERIAQGQFAEAMRVVDERMVVVGVAAKTWNDADLNRDGKLLDSYKTVIASAAQNPSLAQSELGDYLKKSLTYNAYQRTR